MTTTPETEAPRADGEAPTRWTEPEDFLALEARPLLDLVGPGLSVGELEDTLLMAIRRPEGAPANDAEREIFPQTRRADALAWTRERLEIAVRGFFRRSAIKAAIPADAKREMLRTMLLTRELDAALKRAFDSREIHWESYPSPQKGFPSLGQEAIVGAAGSSAAGRAVPLPLLPDERRWRIALFRARGRPRARSEVL